MLSPLTLAAEEEALVVRVSRDLRELALQLNLAFPEREWLIKQVILALMTGHNVLVWGTFGTAKTLFSNVLFEAIVGPGVNGEPKQVFYIQLDQETSKSDLIGPPNVHLYEETGVLQYNVEGYLPTAHFTHLDEVFDALSVLRGIHDILNEKELNEGRQQVRVPLMTALATTNRSPQEVEEMLEMLDLEAFSDRFLMVANVGYLEQPESRIRMITHFLEGHQVKATVQFADLQRIMSLVKQTNQFPNRAYVEVYDRVIAAYGQALRQETGRVVSDRRRNWLTQVVEAGALLQGRSELYLDDILSVAYGLCDAPDSSEMQLFTRVSAPILEEARLEFGEKVDEAERNQLKRIEEDLSQIKSEVKRISYATDEEVGRLLRRLSDLYQELKGVRPRLDHNEQLRVSLIKQIDSLQSEVSQSLF